MAKNLRASATAACASASAAPISSQILWASSPERSAILSSGNFTIAFASACTACSTLATFWPDACICVARFRSAVSFFSSASFPAPTSRRFCKAASSLAHASWGPLANSLMSTNFCTTNVRAAAIAFCVTPADSSQAATAAAASAPGNDSKPFKKGSSASPHFDMSDSAFSTCSVASLTISEQMSRSFCSFEAWMTVASFFSAAVILDRMADNSSRSTPEAVFNLTSTSFDVAVNFVCASAVALSMRSTCSGEGCSSACVATATAATLSTSLSVAVRRVATSASMVLTRSRSSASFVIFRNFAISCCTLLTLVCNLPSSLPDPAPAPANFFKSAVFCSKCFLAITKLACAERSARFACSTASRPLSEANSPAIPRLLKLFVASAMRTTSSSADLTFTSTSSSKWTRLRSPVLDRNCCNLSRPSSTRFVIMSISSFTALAVPSEKRATSTSFRAMKVCASAIAVCTATAILSAS
mmetsp:Transcript_107566/g.343169  ORF Transcript_107566/g.343169 Transcript_107566/m.343169 type:complete len:473 (+) Transcript_107566:2842-4260(+)